MRSWRLLRICCDFLDLWDSEMLKILIFLEYFQIFWNFRKIFEIFEIFGILEILGFLKFLDTLVYRIIWILLRLWYFDIYEIFEILNNFEIFEIFGIFEISIILRFENMMFRYFLIDRKWRYYTVHYICTSLRFSFLRSSFLVCAELASRKAEMNKFIHLFMSAELVCRKAWRQK